MYTVEDYEKYRALTKQLAAEQGKIKQRACEVFIRIYAEYLRSCPEDALNDGCMSWYDGCLSDACKQAIGLTAKDSRLGEVDVSLGEDGNVYLRSTFTSQGETDYMYGDFDSKFLWDEDALTEWIQQANAEYAERLEQKKALEDAEVEARERAEFERLKAKFGN